MMCCITSGQLSKPEWVVRDASSALHGSAVGAQEGVAGSEYCCWDLHAEVAPRPQQGPAVGFALEYDDIVNEGRLGALHAVRRFDPARGVKFFTYAVLWIKQYVRRCIENHSRTIRVPVHSNRTRNSDDFKGVNCEQRLRALDVRLDASLLDGDATALDNIASEAPTPEDALEEREASEERSQLYAAIVGLQLRERVIVEQRAEGRTLSEIGAGLGLSRERVRQIEAIAMGKLRAKFKKQ